MIAQFVAIVILVLVLVLVVSFVLAHFGIVVLLALGVILLGRHLRRSGV